MFNDGELCNLLSEFVSIVKRPGMAPELVWRVSWVLNGIGYNIVELSVFDWLAAIRRQHNKMYTPVCHPHLWWFCILALTGLLADFCETACQGENTDTHHSGW